MLHPVESLSKEQRQAVESLLRRALAPHEVISIRALDGQSVTPEPGPEAKAQALVRLEAYFSLVDARRAPVSEAAELSVIEEALRSTRPGFRPVE